MLADRELTVDSLRWWANLRNGLLIPLFVAVSWVLSDAALSGGMTTSILLVVGLVLGGLCAYILWRPVIGLYASVLLNIIMDPPVQQDPFSKYTGYFHEDLNTFAHAGVAFNPLELLLIVTTIAYLLRAVVNGRRLRGGTLAPHVLVFASFLVCGYAWGFFTHGDPKIGLFEVRAPFTLVVLYFLMTNLASERQQIEQVLRLSIFGMGLLAVWGIVRFVAIYHGHSGGPDGPFGSVHEDAIFLAFFAVIGLCRLIFKGGRARRTAMLIMLAVPAMFVMFEMQRRAAFASLFCAFVIIAIVLYYKRRRLFVTIVPLTAIVIACYSAVFWNSSSLLAQPIRAWRSQTTSAANLDSRDYSSNEYRINEKANVRATILSAPLTGIGFGHTFIEVAPLPLLPWWPFQFYTPHAEVLWIWLKVGAGGFIAFWTLICVGLMRAGLVVRRVGASPLGFACLAAALYVVMLLVYAYVDVGLANERCEVLLGVMLGIIGAASSLFKQSRGTPSALPIEIPELERSERVR